MRYFDKYSKFRDRKATLFEVLVICLVMFSLPLFEAPKNIFSVAFVILWITNSIRLRSLGGKCLYSWPLILLTVILWVSPIFSDFGDIINITESASRWSLLAVFVLLVGRLNYSQSQYEIILAFFLIGSSVAIFESIWVWNLNGKEYPELRSVGHVNHSAMYTLVTFAASLGVLYYSESWMKFLGILSIALTFVFLLPASSIVAVLSVCSLIFGFLFISSFSKWSVRRAVASAGIFLFVSLIALSSPFGEPLRQDLAILMETDVLSGRIQIARSALAVWDDHILVGTGWGSFGVATSEQVVRAALASKGYEYSADLYWHFPHGHNLWINTLIERGLLGVGLLLLLIALYVIAFVPVVFSRRELSNLDRGAAIVAFLVVINFLVAGLGNTTMMNEHGHAGMALISVCYGYLRGRGIVGQNRQLL